MLPKSLREVIFLAKQNKMATRGGLFFSVRWARTYQERTILKGMAECEVIEILPVQRKN